MGRTKYSGDYKSELSLIVPNVWTHLSSANSGSYLNRALREYSRINPRRLSVGTMGGGSATLSLPASFNAEFSKMISVEYPTGNVPPTFISQDEFHLFEEGGNSLGQGTLIQFLGVAPTTADALVFTYTVQHSMGTGSTTVEDVHFEAVSYLHAAHACEAIAGRLADSIDSTLASDSVDHTGQADRYKAQSKRYRNMAYLLLDVQADPETGKVETGPEDVEIDWNQGFQHGADYLFHGRPR